MARGLPKKYIKAFGVTKKAWREYRKDTGKKKTTKSKANKPKKTTTKRRTLAQKKRRRRNKFTIPLAVVAPLVWKISSAAQAAMAGDMDAAKADLLWHFAAIDSNGQFNLDALKTWIPVIAGAAIHKFVGGAPLNLNRYLKDVPLLRI